MAKKAIKSNVDAVICYSMNETKCFEYLRKRAPHIKRIVDCANAPVAYMKYIYEQDIAAEELKKEVPSFWNIKELHKQQHGIELTQFFLAPSNFVKQGLIYCGVDSTKIDIVPYGTNFSLREQAQGIPEEVKFIYVGQVTHRKGMHYLLQAFSELQKHSISLTIVGGWAGQSKLYEKYKDCTNIHFRGNIPHSEVKELLYSSNVFVFTSLTEGLSLACLEALSSGLPIICSSNAGVNDIIIEGSNGFVLEKIDIEKIKEHVLFFVYNKERIPEFSVSAIKTAKKMTWEEHERLLVEALERIEKLCKDN